MGVIIIDSIVILGGLSVVGLLSLSGWRYFKHKRSQKEIQTSHGMVWCPKCEITVLIPNLNPCEEGGCCPKCQTLLWRP